MTEDERYLSAAHRIREDPDLPEELAPALDELLVEAAHAEGDARTDAIDNLLVKLRDDPWAAQRLAELMPDHERSVPGWIDGVLSGEDTDTSELLEFTCRVCGYVNELAYQPVADDMPPCQNPDEARHDLVLD